MLNVVIYFDRVFVHNNFDPSFSCYCRIKVKFLAIHIPTLLKPTLGIPYLLCGISFT